MGAHYAAQVALQAARFALEAEDADTALRHALHAVEIIRALVPEAESEPAAPTPLVGHINAAQVTVIDGDLHGGISF